MSLLTPLVPAPSTCLIEMIAPYVDEGEEASSTKIETDPEEIPKFEPMTKDVRNKLAPLVADLRARRFERSCDNDLTRCPLVGVMLGGALAGGDKLLNSVAEAFQDWFFRRWMPRMTLDVASAINLMRLNHHRSETTKENVFVGRLSNGIGIARSSQNELRQLARCLEQAIKGLREKCEQSGQDILATVATDWKHSLINASGIVHDTGTIVQAYASAVGLAILQNDPFEATKMLQSLQGIDFSSLQSTANCLATINRSRAQEKMIQLHVGSMPLMVLRPAQRVAFALTAQEELNNAIKYADTEHKQERHIGLVFDTHRLPWRTGPDVEVEDFFGRFGVRDNGVGIPDMAALLEDLREGQLKRQRPDLAEGDGRGIANIVRRAAREGWGYALVSAPGVGTDSWIYISMSSIEEFRPMSKRDETRSRRTAFPMPLPSRGMPLGEKRRRVRGEPPTPEGLAAAVLDEQSLLRTLGIMGQAIGALHYFGPAQR